MKITKKELQKIIKEELSEAYGGALGPFPGRYGLPPVDPIAEEPGMYTADDELRELGDKISEMVVLSRQVEELMLDMGMRYGELAVLGTNARIAKKTIKELEDKYGQKLDDIARFSKHGEGLDEKLKASDGAGAYVTNFRQSDAPQFQGKGKKKRQQMAIAAYLQDKEDQGKK